MVYYSHNREETLKIAKEFAKSLKSGDIVLLYGDLGAGKTVFVKGVVSAFCSCVVTSPTFTIVNTYEANIPLYHFDLYRLQSEEELYDIGAEELLFGNGISLVEWPEKKRFWPATCYKVSFEKIDETTRKICIGEA